MKTEKSDRRVRYTKMVLKQSLLECMRVRPIGRISVKDICDGADINRGTFYAHYSDPYDLLASIENELFEDILTCVATLSSKDVSALLAEIFSSIEKNRELCSILFSENGDKKFLRRIVNIAHDASIGEWKRRIPGAGEEQLELLYVFISNGSAALIQDWIQSVSGESPREIAAFIEKISTSGLNALK